VPALFCDASAIVKRYASETGSVWVIQMTRPASGNTIYLARITRVEVVSAITRRTREGTLSAADGAAGIADLNDDFLRQYRVVETTAPLIDRAVSLVQSHGLRAYDAVQLAALLEINDDRVTLKVPSMILVSADRALNDAAIAEGIAVDDPNGHP
jgi:uncharacterized protein